MLRLSGHCRPARALGVLCAAFTWAAISAGGAGAQTHSDLDDIGTDSEKPAKPKSAPANNKKASPAKKLNAAPANVPGSRPAAKPPTRPAKPPARHATQPAGGIAVAGIRYASMDHYLFGVWRWRNPQGQVILFTFARNRSFIFTNITTGVRLFGHYRTQGYVVNFFVRRGCRQQDCRVLPKVHHRRFPFQPQSTNVVLSGNEVWRRVSRY